MIPNRIPVSMPIERRVPGTSTGLAFGSFEVGTSQTTATTETATTGRFTKNTEPHQKWSSR